MIYRGEQKMVRNGFVGVLAVLLVARTSQYAVVITSEKLPSALAGHSLWRLTALSTVPADTILGFDFEGNPANNDPATGRGFFGPMSQINPAGQPTIFQDNNP